MNLDDPSTADQFVGAMIGAAGVGAVGLLFFFVKRYFTNREDQNKETRTKADATALAVARLEGKLDAQTDILLETRDDVKFVKAQMIRVFDYIDAPSRATDKRKGMNQ